MGGRGEINLTEELNALERLFLLSFYCFFVFLVSWFWKSRAYDFNPSQKIPGQRTGIKYIILCL